MKCEIKGLRKNFKANGNTLCTGEGTDLQGIRQELPLSIIYKDVK